MKKRICAGVLAACMLAATGCGVRGAAGEESTSLLAAPAPVGGDESQPTRALSEAEAENAPDPDPEQGGAYQTLASNMGGRQFEEATIQGGTLYQLVWDEENNVTLAGGPTGGAPAVLCEEGGCSHDSEACPAWFGNNMVSRLYSVNGSLVVITENWDEGLVQFTTLATDGTGRQTLANLPASQLAYDFIAQRGNSLYFVLYEGESSTVTRLDLTTGENGVVLTLAERQSCIGTVGQRLAVHSYEGENDFSLRLVDNSGEEEEVLRYNPEEETGGFFEESFYLVHHTTGRVRKIDLASGVETELGSITPLPARDEDTATGAHCTFVALLGETLVLDAQILGADFMSDETTRWLLDVNGQKEPVQSGLTTSHTGDYTFEETLTILHNTGDALVVIPAITHSSQTLTGTDGAAYDAPMEKRSWAMISHDNFLAGNPVYTELTLY